MNEDLKRCSKCDIEKELSEFNFRKDTQKYRSECIQCSGIKHKEWRNINPDKIKQIQKKNNEQNKEKRNIYLKNERETDVKYRLITNTRSRIYKSLKGMTKQSSTKEISGIDVNTYRKWLEFQFTPEMNWSNIEIDRVKPICMFDVSDDEQLKEAFSWKNTQPLLKHDHQKKGIKFNILDYQLQFIKAYQFLKLNEERFNEDIHQ